MKTGSSFINARAGTAIFVLFSVFVRSTAQDPCRDHFTSDTAPIQGVSTTVSVRFNDYSETTAVTSELITISWDENVTATLPTDATFLQYFYIDTSVADEWTITIQESLEGLPDYPDVLTNLVAEASFDGFSDYPSESCTFTIQVFLKDENTQIPEFEHPSYAVDIPENYLVGFVISDLDVRVRDNDGGPPNQDVTVSADSGCPLEPAAPDQSGFQGQFKRVDMKLKESLDYENQKTFTCAITATDKGAGFLSTEAALTITVINVPDEPPAFGHDYYYATLDSNLVGTPLDILPEQISASDGDQISPSITYALSDAKPGVVGTDYFHINPDTGVVTLTMELDDTMLLNEKLLFFVTATDESLDSSNAVLEVTLPPAPTPTPPTTDPSTTLSTTEFTCPPCTTADLWTTQTTTTCEPCPSTDTPCPTVPTTAGTTCPPCTTVSTTECPTTIESQTCTPCPTVTNPTTSHGTECPTVPTCPPCTTDSPVTTQPNNKLSFKQASYAGEIYASFSSVFTLTVVVEGIQEDEVTFSLESTTDFVIDPATGEITVQNSNLNPGLYNFKAIATANTDPGLTDTANVQVVVLPSSPDLVLTNSLYMVTTPEEVQEETVLFDINVDGAQPPVTICISNVQPPNYRGYFVTEENSGQWQLKKVVNKTFNYEEVTEIRMKLQVFDQAVEPCPTESPNEILRNEALVLVEIGDTNDNKPMFVVPSSNGESIAYPEDVSLQKVVGPVITLQATDDDANTKMTYSIGVNDQFTVDANSGEVFVDNNFSCEGEGCQINITASDGEQSADEWNIKVISLDMEHIHTLTMTNIDASEVDNELKRISGEIGAKLSKVYVNPVVKPSGRGTDSRSLYQNRWKRLSSRTSSRANQWQIEVNIYAVDSSGTLMDLTTLNGKLAEASLDPAASFVDKDTFNPPTTGGGGDTTGLKVAVGILGALLGLVLIAAGFLIYKQRRSKAQKQRKISTVGGAYPNLGYDTDKTDRSSTVGKMSNGINGSVSRTSANHIGDADRDSPPLLRSTLFDTKDSPATESRGLRRTDPGTPDLYSKSSRAPPPIYQNTIDNNSLGRPSSVSSSVAETPPLYPSLTTTTEDKPYLSSYGQKNKKSPPPLNATPAKSILRGPSDSENHEAYPLTNVSVQKNAPAKPEDPETDYDKENDVAASTFGGLRSSPILKRASVVVMDSDHEDDNKSIKSYSSLDAKKSNLKHDKSDSDGEEEERKSVAFKVLVDTKTIEPENMGPAQRAAAQADAQSDALDILEANKKKMEDSSSEGEDDDEENNVRL